MIDLFNIEARTFFHRQRFIDIKVNIFCITVSYHTVVLAGQQQIDRIDTHHRSMFDIHGCRNTAALNMTKDGRTGFDTSFFFNRFRYLLAR